MIEDVIRAGNYHLIDVREPMELDIDGEVEGATNIPLGDLDQHKEEIKNLHGNLIFFCRSGGRSKKAVEFFENEGLTNVYDGGGFKEVILALENA